MTSEPTETEIKYAKYKWEFMRRNLRYIKEWMELEEIQKTAREEFEKEKIDFCDRWRVTLPLNPRTSYDNIIMDESGEGQDKPTHDMHKVLYTLLNLPDERSRPPVEIKDGWDNDYGRFIARAFKLVSDRLSKTGILTIQVDLNYSKNKLKEELETFVEEWKGLYENAYRNRLFMKFQEEALGRTLHGPYLPTTFADRKVIKALSSAFFGKVSTNVDSIKQFEEAYKQELKEEQKKLKDRQKKYRKKYHFDNFDIYLQVYDLKEEKGISWNKIASELFPKDPNGVQTARNHHKAACELIEKGISLYVK